MIDGEFSERHLGALGTSSRDPMLTGEAFDVELAFARLRRLKPLTMRATGRVIVEVGEEIAVEKKIGNTKLVAAKGPNREIPIQGVVIAVSSDCTGCKVGDEVVYSKYSGAYIAIWDKEYLIIPERDLLGVYLEDERTD